MAYQGVDYYVIREEHDQRVVEQSETAQQKRTKRLQIHLEDSRKSIKRTLYQTNGDKGGCSHRLALGYLE